MTNKYLKITNNFIFQYDSKGEYEKLTKEEQNIFNKLFKIFPLISQFQTINKVWNLEKHWSNVTNDKFKNNLTYENINKRKIKRDTALFEIKSLKKKTDTFLFKYRENHKKHSFNDVWKNNINEKFKYGVLWILQQKNQNLIYWTSPDTTKKILNDLLLDKKIHQYLTKEIKENRINVSTPSLIKVLDKNANIKFIQKRIGDQ